MQSAEIMHFIAQKTVAGAILKTSNWNMVYSESILSEIYWLPQYFKFTDVKAWYQIYTGLRRWWLFIAVNQS